MQRVQWPGVPYPKRYMGDGVYACFNEARQLELTTENGISVLQTIYLEPEVWCDLLSYVQAAAIVVEVPQAPQAELPPHAK